MLLAASALMTAAASANPTAPQVVNGNASFQPAGNVLQITNTPNIIINWRQSFSIGVNEITRSVNQSSASAALNGLVGQNPSAILNPLQSNGRVFLINPNAMPFGRSAPQTAGAILGSGNKLELVDPATPNLRVEIKAQGNQPLDLGRIADNVQRNGIYGGLVNKPAGVTADRAVIGADGRIYLRSSAAPALEMAPPVLGN